MKIIGTGSALPKKVVTNDMLTEFFDTSDEWIRTRTGISTRRILTDESLIDLAIEASQKALESANLKAEDLDFILCSNVNNNYVYPSMSSIVQGKIGAKCPCTDLRNACAGFIYALDVADAFIQTGRAKKILVLAAEEPTRFCHWEHRETSVLFGDGAGAAVVTDGGEYKGAQFTTISMPDVLYQRQRLEPTPFEDLSSGAYINQTMVMQGREVFKMAVTCCSNEISKLLDIYGYKKEDVKYFVLHQANLRIINGIQQYLGADASQFPTTVEKYGNTSSASVPILLDELVKGNKIQRGDVIVMSGFGAGFTTGSLLMKY